MKMLANEKTPFELLCTIFSDRNWGNLDGTLTKTQEQKIGRTPLVEISGNVIQIKPKVVDLYEHLCGLTQLSSLQFSKERCGSSVTIREPIHTYPTYKLIEEKPVRRWTKGEWNTGGEIEKIGRYLIDILADEIRTKSEDVRVHAVEKSETYSLKFDHVQTNDFPVLVGPHRDVIFGRLAPAEKIETLERAQDSLVKNDGSNPPPNLKGLVRAANEKFENTIRHVLDDYYLVKLQHRDLEINGEDSESGDATNFAIWGGQMGALIRGRQYGKHVFVVSKTGWLNICEMVDVEPFAFETHTPDETILRPNFDLDDDNDPWRDLTINEEKVKENAVYKLLKGFRDKYDTMFNSIPKYVHDRVGLEIKRQMPDVVERVMDVILSNDTFIEELSNVFFEHTDVKDKIETIVKKQMAEAAAGQPHTLNLFKENEQEVEQ